MSSMRRTRSCLWMIRQCPIQIWLQRSKKALRTTGPQKVLSTCAAVVREAGIEADTTMKIVETLGPHIYDAIEEEAAGWPADLIVIGTMADAGFAVCLLGWRYRRSQYGSRPNLSCSFVEREAAARLCRARLSRSGGEGLVGGLINERGKLVRIAHLHLEEPAVAARFRITSPGSLTILSFTRNLIIVKWHSRGPHRGLCRCHRVAVSRLDSARSHGVAGHDPRGAACHFHAVSASSTQI